MTQPPGPGPDSSSVLHSLRASAGATALVAAAFSAVVGAMLLWNLLQTRVEPSDSEDLRSLKADLVSRPASAPLKAQIRELDWRLRNEFFSRRQAARKGAVLLVAGVILFFAVAGLRMAAPAQPGKPGSPPADEEAFARFARRARMGVLVAVLLLGGGAAGWALYSTFLGGSAFPPLSARAPSGGPIQPPVTTTRARTTEPTHSMPADGAMEELRRQWPRFRGAFGAGVCDGPAPTQWDGATGAGILWKAEVPLPGFSSPIVWGGRVYLTGADKKERRVYCLDANSGAILWDRDVTTDETPPEPPEVLEATGYAAPTAATDGNHVCAVFANGDIACFDPNGKALWALNLHLLENTYGYASSLDIVDGLVIVQVDQGGESEGKSRLVALDAQGGSVVWEVVRPGGGAWTSPIVVPVAGRWTVITVGTPFTMAHDLSDNSEIWRARVGGADAAPSPVFAGGLVFSVQSNNEMDAIRPDGNGDVTETHVAWKTEESVPDIASPLSDGRLVWTLTTQGDLSCYEVAKGEKVYSKELKMPFQASPSMAGGRLYLLSETGTMLILEGGRDPKEVARCAIEDTTVACPAFAGGRIYIRGKNTLYCVGAAGK